MLNPRIVKILLVIYYCVGIIGFSVEATYPLMVKLVPWSLLLSFGVLLIYHKKWSTKIVFAFITIAIISFFVEMAGTKTGLIFGNYWYGNTLGLKLLETPLIIAVNWLVLIYTINLLINKWRLNLLLHATMGALLMTIFDFVMEPVAIKTDMWQWANNIIPFQNYVAWFGLSFILFAFIKKLKIDYSNPIAITLLVCQFSLFAALRLIIVQ